MALNSKFLALFNNALENYNLNKTVSISEFVKKDLGKEIKNVKDLEVATKYLEAYFFCNKTTKIDKDEEVYEEIKNLLISEDEKYQEKIKEKISYIVDYESFCLKKIEQKSKKIINQNDNLTVNNNNPNNQPKGSQGFSILPGKHPGPISKEDWIEKIKKEFSHRNELSLEFNHDSTFVTIRDKKTSGAFQIDINRGICVNFADKANIRLAVETAIKRGSLTFEPTLDAIVAKNVFDVLMEFGVPLQKIKKCNPKNNVVEKLVKGEENKKNLPTIFLNKQHNKINNNVKSIDEKNKVEL
ncbi:hypothetical protein PsalN5692_00610 [Piscirickettsia salmonis]|uniref:hypothetical protein n=1 Tax=Piscirickettsia salmonis TaxID=1238 RepID=UPI0012B9E322|nr:hypothetical protein [Piscirickettsia salmonis]QGP49188.1 hypothetical protein PsalN5692_00610 [Piscirickettsia salmonis]